MVRVGAFTRVVGYGRGWAIGIINCCSFMACGGETTNPTGFATGGSTAIYFSTGGVPQSALESCPALARFDVASGCSAARYLVNCTDQTGTTCGCTSNTANQCPFCTAAGPGVACQNQCSDAEYVVTCASNYSAACHLVEANPAGVASYCCPCAI